MYRVVKFYELNKGSKYSRRITKDYSHKWIAILLARLSWIINPFIDEILVFELFDSKCIIYHNLRI